MSKINWTESNIPVCTPSLPLGRYQNIYLTNWMHSWSPLEPELEGLYIHGQEVFIKRKWIVLHPMIQRNEGSCRGWPFKRWRL
jgi:hypothetical protein